VGETEAGGHGGPLERALHVVGDRWSLLALHEIGHGAARFNEIQRRTGMPRDRLAQRLRRLETWSVIGRRCYCEHPPRYEYSLTEAGRSLLPVLAAMEHWGRQYT
jgi:DNA-binding HxlR family transcriptional regulator